MPHIAIIGSLNADLCLTTTSVPRPGETLQAGPLSIGAGGKGLNQAIACHRLAAAPQYSSHGEISAHTTVQFYGAVGDDAFSSIILQTMREDGLDTSKVQVLPGGQSGTAVVMVDAATAENRIIVSRGANCIGGAEFVDALPTPLPDVLIMQMEIEHETVFRILRLAAVHEPPVRVLLNVAPASDIPDEFYPLIDTVVANETEIMTMCGQGGISDSVGLDFMAGLAKEVLAKGVRMVLLTLGAQGCYFAIRDGAEGLVPAQKVSVVDTTAAGDTFIGAMGVQLAQGFEDLDIEAAIHWANRCAAVTVSKNGAYRSIPWASEVARYE